MNRFASTLIQPRRAWVIALFMILVGGGLIGALGEGERVASPTDSLVAGSDSARAAELADTLPAGDVSSAVVLYTADSGTLTTEQLATITTDFAARLAEASQAAGEAGDSGSGEGSGEGSAGPPGVIPSEDGSAAIGILPVTGAAFEDVSTQVIELRAGLREAAPDGVTVQVTGPAAIQTDLGAVFDGANTRLLLVTAGVVALLLLITYRSPFLWLIPLVVVGIADRLAAVLATHVLTAVGVAWDESTIGILSVLVFGAGTDYALLLISRYRDELRFTPDRYEAMRRAVRFAGEAIVSSSTTVVLGVLTLLLSLVPTTRGLGLASAIGVVVAAVFVLVALPAVLVLFGRWVFWPLVPREGQSALVDSNSIWRRVGNLVAKRPGAWVAGTLLLLLALSAGTTQVTTGLTTADQFLQKPEAISAAERLAESFPAGSSDPVVVVTKADPADVAATAKTVGGVSSATPGRSADGLSEVDVVLEAEPGSAEAVTGIRDLRAALADFPDTYVGGSEAQALDSAEGAARDRLVIFPLIILLVLVALVVLLRSIVAPVILVLTVVATFFAAMGASWWLFTLVFDFAALDVGAPLIAFLFLVALGVDYNIFLVTRAREEAVDHGSRAGMLRALTATGGVITSAGILLAAVFAVLGVLPLVVLAQIGVIICVGVLLDTLVVRTVLVPAIALVLGDRFWWPRTMPPPASEREAASGPEPASAPDPDPAADPDPAPEPVVSR